MAIIKGENIETVKYDRKIFALNCGCNSSWIAAFHEAIRCYDKNSQPFFGKCERCGYNPWIILPKEGGS
jgi:hypothetical protein